MDPPSATLPGAHQRTSICQPHLGLLRLDEAFELPTEKPLSELDIVAERSAHFFVPESSGFSESKRFWLYGAWPSCCSNDG